jgi:hypothetical protein
METSAASVLFAFFPLTMIMPPGRLSFPQLGYSARLTKQLDESLVSQHQTIAALVRKKRPHVLVL